MKEKIKFSDLLKSCEKYEDYERLISFGVNEIIPMTNKQLLKIIEEEEKFLCKEKKYAEIN